MFDCGKRLDKITVRLEYASVLWNTRQVFDYSDTTLIHIHHGMFTPPIYLPTLSLIYSIARPDVMTVSFDGPTF